jgi:hypothetical protein
MFISLVQQSLNMFLLFWTFARQTFKPRDWGELSGCLCVPSIRGTIQTGQIQMCGNIFLGEF